MVPQLFSIILRFALDGFSKNSQSDSVKLNPNVTFSIATSISCTSTQEEMEFHDIRAESLAWQSLIARVHNGEIAPIATVGKRLLSLIPMHVTEQTPMSWADVFRP